MKVFPTKADFEHIFESNHPKRGKTKIKNDGTSAILTAFYIAFMKNLAEETEKLLYLDNTSFLREQHIAAASKIVISNCSYRQVVRNKLRSIGTEDSQGSSDEEFSDES